MVCMLHVHTCNLAWIHEYDSPKSLSRIRNIQSRKGSRIIEHCILLRLLNYYPECFSVEPWIFDWRNVFPFRLHQKYRFFEIFPPPSAVPQPICRVLYHRQNENELSIKQSIQSTNRTVFPMQWDKNIAVTFLFATVKRGMRKFLLSRETHTANDVLHNVFVE